MIRILRPRILCVDDEPSVIELLKALLEIDGQYAVDIETDPTVVVDRARKSRPDLVFLDVNMPQLSGIELARELRKEAGLCRTPIIFFTGVPDFREAALKASGEGPAYFITKGSPLAEIEELVGTLLEERLRVLREALPPWAMKLSPPTPPPFSGSPAGAF